MTVRVVKVGGELAEPPHLQRIARDLAALDGSVVLVHGGGQQLDQALAEQGSASPRVAGRRVTSPNVLSRAIAVWRGTLSTRWVTALTQAGRPAVGLCGADGGLLLAARRPPRIVDGQVVDYGEVGDLQSCDPAVLQALLAIDLVPVVSPLVPNDAGALLNVNADTVAAFIAATLHAELVVLTSADGVLADPDDPDSGIPSLTTEELDRLLASPAIRGGMQPKLQAIRSGLHRGLPCARVIDGRQANALLRDGGSRILGG